MQENIEVELKFQILNESQLHDFLSKLDYKGDKRVVDVYLDTKDGDLFKQGIFVRIRDDKNLDFKFSPENLSEHNNQKFDYGHCDEYSFSLPLTPDALEKLNEVSGILSLNKVENADLEEFKSKNNLIEAVVIDKNRKKYLGGKFEISLDDVKDVGKTVEIEYLASRDEDLEKIKSEMKEFLSGIELKRQTTGYNELYLRKHNFDLYLQGKYLLEEDYEKYRPHAKTLV